jgi:Transcriptional regulator
MAWDTERTRRLLLDAAAAEFSAHGLAGARVDRIAAEAGVNKERIYSYFGNKERLFGAVIEDRLAAVMDAVPIEGSGIPALADYAGRLFDYHDAHPELARLTVWEGLEGGVPAAEEARSAACERKVVRLREAIPELDEEAAREVLLTVVTLCDGYPALSNLDRLYFGAVAATASRAPRRRAAIVATVTALATALVAAC